MNDEFDVIDLPVVDDPEIQDEISARSAWVVGEDIVPSVYYQAYAANSAWNSDDESTYRVWIEEEPSEVDEALVGAASEIDLIVNPVEAEPGEESAEPEVRDLLNVTANKWGYAAPGEVAYIQIYPSEDLEEAYPDVIVSIDGKEYAGLAILDNPVLFHMDKDHRIIIDWAHGEVYESFRIVVNR